MNRLLSRRHGAPAALALACVLAALTAPAALAKTYVVDPNIPDTAASSPCTSPCALRQAVADAQHEEELNFGPVESTIELAPGTYTMTDGPLQVRHPWGGTEEHTTTLVGAGGYAREVVITADGKSRVLTDGNNGGTSGAVVLKRLEITGGDGTGRSFEVENEGGGIAVEQNGDLTLDEVLVTGNTAASSGGGIQDNGELDVEASTIADNEVTGGLGVGGGVASYAAGGSNQSVTIVNSTIVGNSITGGSAKQGGGIFDGTTLALENATVAGNITATGGGGGLASSEGGGVGASTLANDILAYNTGGDCAGRAPTSLGGNLADDSSCALKATDDKQSTNPQLVKEGAVPKLAENGSSTPTVETQSPSPAIEAGLPSHCQKRDQRGYLRKTPCSPGAFELFATFAQEPYVVSGSPSPSAGGKVTAAFIAGSGPHCSGGQCTVERYSEVALTATPNPGYGFVGWSGAACLSQQSPCRLPDISEDHTMTADFAPRYKLTGRSRPGRGQHPRHRLKPVELVLERNLRSHRWRHGRTDGPADGKRAVA